MSLTPREHEVAALVARGLSYKSVGAKLGISAETVGDHVRNAAARIPGCGTPKIKIVLFVLNLDRSA